MDQMLNKIYFLLILKCTLGQQWGQQKLDVIIYYETLCSDTQKFFVKQLYPSMRSMQRLQHTNLILIPYGKVKKQHDYSTGRTELNCQHGQQECKLNAIDACIIENYRVEEILEFRYCMFNQYLWSPDANKCASKSGIDMNIINSCLSQRSIPQILERYGQMTSNIHLTYVPSIAIGGEFIAQDQDQILNSFDKIFCRKFYVRFQTYLNQCY